MTRRLMLCKQGKIMFFMNSVSSVIKKLCTVTLLPILTACGGEPQLSSSNTQSSAQKQTIYEWKLITSWPKNLPALGTSPEHFADIVEKMSNGRMRIRVYGANELVGGLEVFDAVSQGVAEIGHTGHIIGRAKFQAHPSFPLFPSA